MKNSLDYSNRALDLAPEQIHFRFNIAFVQIQLAQLIYTLPEAQRTLQEVVAASEGLDAAIESFTSIAQSKNPPYPKHDIEQRANMGRNTMRRQLERAIQSQREYEERNASKLQQARELREAELRKRDEERRKAEEVALEQKRKLAEERYKMLEISRELAEKRAEEERRKEELEYTTDEETGERIKRRKKKAGGGGKRKKKGAEDDTDAEGSGVDGSGRKGRGKSTSENSALGTSDEERAPKKRRKLARRKDGKGATNFKSSEIIVDSDEEEVSAPPVNANGDEGEQAAEVNRDTTMADGDEDEEAVQRPRKKISRRIDDDDDDEDQGEEVFDEKATENGDQGRNSSVDKEDTPMEDDGEE